METVAVLDFETTGLSPGWGDRATEIAVTLVRDGQIVEQGEPAVLLADSQSALNHLRSELRGGQ